MLRERPIEVWENVIDQLQDDKDALLACARVCRGWTARSRHHLQKWLVLRRPEQVARLAKLVRTGSWEVRSCQGACTGKCRYTGWGEGGFPEGPYARIILDYVRVGMIPKQRLCM